MSDHLLIITGRAGTGKSTVATALASHFGLRVRNIGDILAVRMGGSFSDRSIIGPTFLNRFGFDAYRDLVLEAAQAGTVLDGLRSPTVLRDLLLMRRSVATMQCISCYCEHVGVSSADPYDHWSDEIKHEALVVLPWFQGPEAILQKQLAAVAAVDTFLL